jgi:WD40 repeat protein
MSSFELFLSYHSADRKIVDDVRTILNSLGVSTFIDHWDLTPGLPWPEALERALSSARAVAVFIGQEWGAWQKREMYFALDRQVKEEQAGHGFPVIPVVLPGGKLTSSFIFLNTWVDLQKAPPSADNIGLLLKAVRGEATPRIEDSAGAVCPYLGLAAFDEEHARFFFGREDFSKRLLKAVCSDGGLVGLIGASGSGKSSIVHAGVVPLLRRCRPPDETWEVVSFTPGSDPFRRLAGALVPLLQRELTGLDSLSAPVELGQKFATGTMPIAQVIEKITQNGKSAQRLLVIVDQFEELITLASRVDHDKHPPTKVAAAFVKFMLDALRGHTPIKFLLTLRADFYGHVLGLSRELSDQLERAVVNVGPMERSELERAIVEPARVVGVGFQQGLVQRLLDDFGNQPGELPLLEFTLSQLWNNRDVAARMMTHSAYEQLGGVKEAIDRFARHHFQKLVPEEQAAVKRLFSRLVYVRSADEGEDTRQRVSINELSAGSRQLVEKLADARLLVTTGDKNEETVEVAHESLIREWKDLRGWLEEDRKFLLWRQRLRLSLLEWQRIQLDSGGLLRGVLLTEAKQARKSRPSDLNDAERDYIDRSIKHWLLIRSAAAVLVLAVAVSAAFLWQRLAAERNLAYAGRLMTWATSIKSAGLSRLDRAALFAIASLQVDKSGDPSIVRQAVQLVPDIISPRGLEPAPLQCSDEMTLAVRGAYLACQVDNKSVRVLSATDGNDILMKPVTEGQEMFSVQVSPDGRFVAIGFRTGGFKLLEIGAEQARQVAALAEGFNAVVTFSASGKYFGAAVLNDAPGLKETTPSTMHVFRLSPEAPAQSHRFSVGTGILAAAFSPDDRFVAVLRQGDSSSSTRVTAFGLAESERRDIAGGDVSSTLALSPGGEWMAMPYGNTVRVTNTVDAATFGETAHEQPVETVAFSEDGKWVASGGRDGSVRVMEASSGRLIALLPTNSSIESVTFTAENDLVVLSADKKVKKLNVLRRPAFEALSAIGISPRGTYLSRRGSKDRELLIVERRTGKTILVNLAADLTTSQIQYTVDENSLIVTGSEGVNVYDVKSGQSRATPGGALATTISGDAGTGAQATAAAIRVFSVSGNSADQPKTLAFANALLLEFSPDGTLIAAANGDSEFAVFDTVTTARLFLRKEQVTRAAFSADGRYLAISTTKDEIHLLDARTGAELWDSPMPAVENAVLLFNRDGSVLANGGTRPGQSAFDINLTDRATKQLLLQMPLESQPAGLVFESRYLDILEDTAVTRHYIWGVDLIERACQLITRPLSAAEWNAFMPGDPPRICPNHP